MDQTPAQITSLVAALGALATDESRAASAYRDRVTTDLTGPLIMMLGLPDPCPAQRMVEAVQQLQTNLRIEQARVAVAEPRSATLAEAEKTLGFPAQPDGATFLAEFRRRLAAGVPLPTAEAATAEVTQPLSEDLTAIVSP